MHAHTKTRATTQFARNWPLTSTNAQPQADQYLHCCAVVRAQVAKRVVQAYEPTYIHSSEVARRKRFNPRVMGRITGNVWFTVRAGRSGL